ncbi:hypothetical protein F444_01875 [Phytophthora nicotianae P1976]|uniref:Uncharacterized protein n=1 Tax=Phytophthora nicotianae P1976 TaxID=1317066 RepID=A0A081AZ60_PHYNI|nr:hypothetical protein F444_01875 [Phytophthora nicotianae P1976]
MLEIQDLLTTDIDVSTFRSSTSQDATSGQSDRPSDSINQREIGRDEEQGYTREVSGRGPGEDKCQQQGDKQILAASQQISRTIPEKVAKSTSATSDAPSKVFRSGQHVHVLNDDELTDLCRRMEAQTATLGRAIHQKEKVRQQKTLIQQLEAKLSRLQGVEAEIKQYERRSVESLRDELALHQHEIADLSRKLENAAKKEVDWINTMDESLRK